MRIILCESATNKHTANLLHTCYYQPVATNSPFRIEERTVNKCAALTLRRGFHGGGAAPVYVIRHVH